jgi:hypothetical protein
MNRRANRACVGTNAHGTSFELSETPGCVEARTNPVMPHGDGIDAKTADLAARQGIQRSADEKVAGVRPSSHDAMLAALHGPHRALIRTQPISPGITVPPNWLSCLNRPAW